MKNFREVALVEQNGLLNVETVGEKLFEMFVDRKKISRETFSPENIQYLVKLANRINSCDQFTISMDGLLFSDMRYPEVLSMLIHPSKVSLNADIRSRDLLLHSVSDDVEFDPKKITQITERLYGSFKMAGKYVKLSELRVPKLLNDIKWMIQIDDEWMYNADDVFHWLVPINSCVGEFYENSYFNESANYDLHRYIAEWSGIQ